MIRNLRMLLTGGDAAVDVEDLAGDERRAVRQEEQHRAADVVDLRDAARAECARSGGGDTSGSASQSRAIRVRTTVGATPLTVMPCRASSTACCLTSRTSPPLLLQYAE